MTPDDALAHLRRVLRVQVDREALDAIETELRALRAAALVDPGGAAREEVRLAAADPRREPEEPRTSVPVGATGLVRRATQRLERARRTSEQVIREMDALAARELDGEGEKR